MSSPTKGVERLAEELKSERVKASNALQERAKLRVEVETLNDTVTNLQADIGELRHLLEEANNRLHETNYEIESLQTSERNLNAELQAKAAESKAISAELNSARNENESLRKQMESKDSELQSLKLRCENHEMRSTGREEVIEKLNFEIQQLRRDQSDMEQRNLESYQKLLDITEINEQLKSRISYLEISDKSYEDLKISSIQMRSNYENEINKNEMLNLDIRMLQQKIDEKNAYITRLETGGNELMADRETLMLKIQSLEFSLEQQLSHIEAEVAASAAAREQAEAVTKGREILVLQIKELREAHQEALSQNTALEIKLSSCNAAIAALQSDLSSARDRILEYQAEIERCAGMEVVASEVDNLRIQLAAVKKQLARRDVEEETGSFVPKAVIEREHSTRQVYESVISDLRAEIEKLNNSKDELSRKYEDSRRQAARVEQLEEEIQLYKELAKNITLENQSTAQLASETQERNMKSTQDLNNLMHALHRVQTELESSRLEVQTYMKDNTKLRETMKEFHASKIAADRKSADLHTVNSKLEMQMEELRQKHEAAVIAAEKAQFNMQELKLQISDLQLKEKELLVLRTEHSALNSKMIGIKTASSGREKELYQEVELLRQNKATSQREISALNEKVVVQRQHIDNATQEVNRLRAEIEALNAEKDRYKREVAHNESLRTEMQLSELRKDLEQTVTEWQGMEKEKALKDKVIAQLQADLNKEREKLSLQKMQLNLCEDRLRTANQELSVFRSLDVYHTSKEVELESYRRDKSIQEKHEAAAAAAAVAAAGSHLGGHAAITPFTKSSTLSAATAGPGSAAAPVNHSLLSAAKDYRGGRQMSLADMDNSRQYLQQQQQPLHHQNTGTKRPYNRDSDLISDIGSHIDDDENAENYHHYHQQHLARTAPATTATAAGGASAYNTRYPASAEEQERAASIEARNNRLQARQLQLREKLLSNTVSASADKRLSSSGTGWNRSSLNPAQYAAYLRDDGNSISSVDNNYHNPSSRAPSQSRASSQPPPPPPPYPAAAGASRAGSVSRSQGRPDPPRSPPLAGRTLTSATASDVDGAKSSSSAASNRFNVSPGTVKNAARSLGLSNGGSGSSSLLEAFRPSKVDYEKARKLLSR